jgi:hypothetical protein
MSNYVEVAIEHYWFLYPYTKYLTGHNGFIAGGCFKNIVNKEKVKDIDVFFPTTEEYFKAVAWYDNPENNMAPKYENDKVKAYKDKASDLVIELIKFPYGGAEATISVFDFSIVKFALCKKPGESETDFRYVAIHHKEFFEHLHLKRLVTDPRIDMPYGTFERLFKYAKYGYFPCKETKLHILNNIRSQPQLDEAALSRSLYTGID